jgi:hypothetical protein
MALTLLATAAVAYLLLLVVLRISEPRLVYAP